VRAYTVKSRSCIISTVFLFAVALMTAPWQTLTQKGQAAEGSRAVGGQTARDGCSVSSDLSQTKIEFLRQLALEKDPGSLQEMPFPGARYAALYVTSPAAAFTVEYELNGVDALPSRRGLYEEAKPFVIIGSAALVLALIALNLWILIRRKDAHARSNKLAEMNQKLFVEIEQRRAAQEALKKSEQRYRDLIENINEIVFSTDADGSMTYVSPAVKTVGGYNPSEVVGQPFVQFVFGEDAPRALEYFEKLKSGPAEAEECRVYTKSGEVRWIRFSCRPVYADGGFCGLQGTFSDITDRKWIEEILHDSEQKFRRVVEESPDGIVLVDNRGFIVEWNKGEETIVGLKRDEVMGRYIWDVQHSVLPPDQRTPENYERIKEGVLLLILNGESPPENRTGESEILRPEGGRRIVQTTLFPIHTDKGCMVGSFTRDVTEEKKAEEQVKVSLKEKEVLLKEIHHRVKNNLQVISSLLDLSRLKTENGASRDILTEARNKVYTMALIHSQLYASERADRIDMAEYVRELATHIEKMYVSKGAAVTPLLAIEKIHLTMNQAIPCALVLNELITNAYKHAFRGNTEGTLIITMKKTEKGLIRMEVKDNGVGMPQRELTAGAEAVGAGTLGLRLVQSIVQDQLKGKLEMESDVGLAVLITFGEG
jgi:PAS domain S-box-containing protein